MYDLNELKARVNFLVSHGAPVPIPVTLHGSGPNIAAWDWDTLQFPRPGGEPHEESIEELMVDKDPTWPGPSRALTALQLLKLAPGDPTIRVPYGSAPVPPPVPHPVDNVVGLLRPDGKGYDGATYYDYVLFVNRGALYTTADGRRFRPVAMGTPPMSIYVWVEEK